MTARHRQSPEDLDQHLRDQIDFLERSSGSFDQGFEGEAKRLAIALRVLLHDTPRSSSLLRQTNLKENYFTDTSHGLDPNNVLTQCALTVMQIANGIGRHVAMLDNNVTGNVRKQPFEAWWNATIVIDNHRHHFSRKQIVLAVADTDGGAHVDPTLDEHYARLSRNNSIAWMMVTENQSWPVPGFVGAVVRQIAHEVLKTLKPGYSRRQVETAGGVVMGGVTLKALGPADGARRAGRNEPCPCGSSKKFKKCCGARV